MPTTYDLSDLAAEMKAAQDHARPLPPFSARHPTFDIAAAHTVRALVHRARLAEGARTIGRKIGFTNPRIWDEYGVRAPNWGYMYASTVTLLEDTHATCDLGRFVEPKIEPEIVFRLRTVPPADAEPSAVLEAVEWVAHGYEIVHSHFPGWKFTAADTAAAGALHGALLVGPPQPLSALGSDPLGTLATFSLDLTCDGRQVDRGRGANVLGSPLRALAELLKLLTAAPAEERLQPGEIVTTGTLTAAWAVHAGERWRSALTGIALPGLGVAFDA